MPRPSRRIFIQGLAIMGTLVIVQLLLDASQDWFLLYMPPIGFAFLLLIMFGIQPIILGVLNIILLHSLYDCEGWQIGFWFNGVFILLSFLTINLLIQTIAGAPFSLGFGLVEIILLSYPFGYLAKFSNRGCSENTPKQQSSAPLNLP